MEASVSATENMEISADLAKACQIANRYNELQSKRHTARYRYRKIAKTIDHKRNKDGAKYRQTIVSQKMLDYSLSDLRIMKKKAKLELVSAELECHEFVKSSKQEFKNLLTNLNMRVFYDHSCYVSLYYSNLTAQSLDRKKVAQIALTQELEDAISQ
jgi:hypothetical protein